MRTAVIATVAVFALAACSVAPASSHAPWSPAPSFTTVAADWFEVPFEYALPVGSALQLVGGPPRVDLVGFVDSPSPRSPGDYGLQQRGAGARGIAVVAVDSAVIHPCPLGSRVNVRDAPADLLADLETIGGMTFTPAETTTVDGRPALATSFDAGRWSCKGPADIHPLTGQYVQLALPSRLFVMEVEGETIMIQLWAAGTDDDLAAWLPMAMEFVESMHFVLDEHPTPF